MTRGRKPLPRNLRIVQGNAGHRPIDPDIPDPAVVVDLPRAPAELSVSAQQHWPYFAKLLSDMRVLTDADFPALCMLCESYAIYWEAVEGTKTYGIMAVTPNNHIQRSEYLNLQFKSMDACLKILTEFGLTPSSRMRVRSG